MSRRILIALGGLLGLGAVVAYARQAFAATAPEPPKPPAPKAGTPVPSTQSSNAPTGTYKTAPDDAALDASGWVPFRGVMVTALPLRDLKTGLFARLTYRDALAVAEREGAMLFTTALVDAVNDEGLELDPTESGNSLELVQNAYDASHMATLPYAQKEDARIQAQLTENSWNGSTPVGNGWKDWIRGAAPGMALNYGWRDKKTGKYVQTLGDRHNDQHTDYSQLTRLVKGA